MPSNKNIQAISKPGTNKNKFHCKRCDNDFWTKQKAPKYCGLCKSKLWKEARKYYITGADEPTKTRTKLTGKAAARNRPETIKRERIEKLQNLETRSYNEYQRLSFELDLPTGEFRKMYLPGIIYGMERERDAIKTIGFQLAELEADPGENFFSRRGTLYSYKDRIVYALERIEEHFYKEDCDNCFRDSDPASVERYKIFETAIKTLKIQRDLVVKEITELNKTQPPPTVKPADDKPGIMVTMEKVGKGYCVRDLNGKVLAGGRGSKKSYLQFIADKGWKIQPELFEMPKPNH